MERSQFTFYDSFFRAIKRIKSKSARCDAYDALCEYALYGAEPDLDSMPDSAAIAFELSKPNLDASRRKAESGSKGGSSKHTGSKPEANGEQTGSKKENKNKKENKKENKCYTREADFERFWSAYPKKVDKQGAKRSFCKADVDIDLLLAALEGHKRSAQWSKDGGQYIPNPTTWLNQRRWETELPADKSVPKGASGNLGEAELEAIRKALSEPAHDDLPYEEDFGQ